MPRKTCMRAMSASENGGRFNEAAARCRGKRGHENGGTGDRELASMRPRPDAAENAPIARRRVSAQRPASMRPRPDAAENAPFSTVVRFQSDASMRPRPDAAENTVHLLSHPAASAAGFNEAAARCRGKLLRFVSRRLTCLGFNEAAARCRGKRVHYVLKKLTTKASMRPRPDAAENDPVAARW